MANSETIADDPKPKDLQETFKTSSRPLFDLTSILRVPTEVGDINLCAHHENVSEFPDTSQNQQGSQVLVFATKSGDLILLKVRNGETPVVKRVPWYLDPEKAVVALSFDPSGSWLLVVGADASFALVPVITILSGTSSGTISRHGWATGDVTCFPSQANSLRPTSVTWWENAQWGPVAILGGTHGELAFIDLASGTVVGTANVSGAVKSLHLCHDDDSVFLLITNSNREQWKLLLEKKKYGYCWPLDRAEGDSADVGSNGGFPSRVLHIPARSRLQGLKHFSVEKLSIIKQKIVETRKASSVGAGTLGLSSGSRTKEAEEGSLQKKSETKSGNLWQSIESVVPEKLASHLGETFITPQNFRGLPLLSGYYAPFSLLTVHSMDLSTVPLCIHKLPPHCKDVLLTDRFIFITNLSSQILTIVSCKLSESTLEENNVSMEYNPESVIQSFSFAEGEKLLAIFKKTGVKAKKQEKGLRGGASVVRGGSDSKSVGILDRKQSSQSIFLNFNLSQSAGIESEGMKKSGSFSSDPSPLFIRTVEKINVLSLENREVDTCIAVTTCGAYVLQLRQCPTDLFLELALKKGELEEAERVAQVFNLDLQHLLEIAGDLELASKSFVQAIAFYKLSRCRHLKSVLKFAAGGHSVELLSFIETVSGSSDLAPSERIHLSNLAVMAHVERVLRSSAASSSSNLSDDSAKVTKRSYSPSLMGKFLRFLHNNEHYDEVLAVSVVGQTALWEPLKFLCSRRGLYREALSSLSRFLKSVAEDGLKGNDLIGPKLGSSTSPVAATLLDSGLWECLSETALLQPLLEKPELAAAHMSFISTFLPVLTIPSLERLAALYDPSSPVFYSCLLKMFIDFQKSQNLGISPTSGEDGASSSSHPIGDMLEMFVKIMLYLSHKRNGSVPQYHPELMQWNNGARNGLGGSQENNKRDKIIERLLAAGYAHSALVWNKGVLTWGNAAHGCLGHGPTMSRYGFPQDVSSFPSLGIEVLSVSCGRQHTLALTSNGVYAWGSAQFGQIGIGMSSGQSPYPTLVESLYEEHIIEISAGQYHSMALTEDGRVYTWGWGVYGQLGHGDVEDCVFPTVVKALQGREKITRICGGHCHSLALTDDGSLLAWGSSVFGQLGHGAMGKSSLPVKVLLPEPVTLMATAYFHNLAVGVSNCLYSWGSSPQVLRLQAQAQKKARLILHQQQQQQKPLSPQKSSVNGKKPAAKSSDQEQRSGVDGDSTANTGVEESSEGVRNEAQTTEGESQAHLLPSAVNTSLVLGPITQISCGCHHSALLTKDGTVYTWGRSLDGQVGNGTRREAPFPVPLTSPPPAPPPAPPPPNSSTTLPNLTRLRASHIACGCEFTLALDKSSGKLWAWGSNALAQLGKDLEESSRSAIQGSIVMLKSTKRVIKHPHGVQNSSDLPYLVPWLPPALPTGSPADNLSLSSIPQGKEEVPKYGHLTLHKTLEFFHKYYNSQRLLFNCMELENYQAAAKIVALESHFHQALAYQLKALYLASKSSSSPDKEKKAGSRREGGILRVDEEEEDEELSKVGIEAMLHGSRRCETHSFAIQGGAEEMSEGGGGIPSPACPCEEESEAQLSGKEKGISERNKVSNDSHTINGDIHDKKELSAAKLPEKNSTVCRQEYVESVPNGLSFGICNIGEGNDFQKPVDEPWSGVDGKDKGDSKMSVLKPEEELAYRASLVVEHYASLLEEEGHLMIRRLLEQGINFWLAHSLPLSCLETLLIKHMSKFFYPLGLMLFCDWNVDGEEGCEKEGERSSPPGSVLGQLSTRFCLQLCSTLLSHIRHKKIAYPEYVELLAQVMAMQAAPFARDNGGGPPASSTPQAPVLSPDIPYTPEHAMEAVLENLGLIGSGVDSLPTPIHVSGDAVMDVLDGGKESCTEGDQEVSESFVLSKKKEQRGVEAVVFSCGHHFRADRFHQSVLPETELALLGLHHPLPHTARLVRGLFSATIAPKRASSPTLQLACPNCVLSHLQAQV